VLGNAFCIKLSDTGATPAAVIETQTDDGRIVLVRKRLKERLEAPKKCIFLKQINNLQKLWIGHPSLFQRSSVTLL
jgi:hypothetical protein